MLNLAMCRRFAAVLSAPLSTEVLSVMVPGGCRSQRCHGYPLRWLAAAFRFFRHLPHTHLLAMA